MFELFSPKIEEKILNFWQLNQIFKKSLKNREGAKKFIFYEGPPSANGRPGIHHVLSRVYKDIICRYKTMAGFYVPRKAGWDTHGLPIELQVEKNLGLKSKKDIEKYGVTRFNEKAEELVWQYKEEWDKLTERIGFWLDLKDPYVTYAPCYIESLWRIIKKTWEKRLLYEDFKVVPYCPRCGTALSSHEVALGYERIAENSVYLRFKTKTKNNHWSNTSILSWTTTPWTLPGNVALAVNPGAKYVRVPDPEEKGHWLILGYDNFNALIEKGFFPKEYKNFSKLGISFFSGREMVGVEYEPLFNIPQLRSEKSYKVYSADFVTTEDGTGVVHTAVMYGEDDFNLGKKVGLPKFHTVDLGGKFIQGVGFGLGGVYVKSDRAESIILNYLKDRNFLFKVSKYEHDYPFCWRCASPLLYYAKSSWFIRMEKLKKKLISNNKKINWIPDHIKNGRFGEWLNEVKDWAFSRERYWGTPLPLWQCRNCRQKTVVGSLNDLDKRASRKPNKYIFLRHGEALNNRLKILSSYPEKRKFPLTIKGRKEIEKLIPAFKKKKIDLIFSSDLLRTKETAQIIAAALGKKIIFNKRLREHDFGIYNGGAFGRWHLLFGPNKYALKPSGGESLKDVQKRMIDFLRSMDEKYEGKTILIISHANPILAAGNFYQGGGLQELFSVENKFAIDGVTGSVREMPGHNWPYNRQGNLDLHRPHIDNIALKCPKCGGTAKRINDVIDVWFDSGAMPFAAGGLEYPADFISEGVDQTRGWFYTLHAVGVLMDKGPAYKNVISLGHILDEKGEKMSKSKNNTVDPWKLIDKYGIDALRWYFFTINSAGEPKKFAVRDVEERLRRFVLTVSNVVGFYKTYSSKIGSRKLAVNNLNVIDRWILSRLHQTIKIVRANLNKYEVTAGARPINEFVDDLSRWWLRRSRERFKSNTLTSVTAVFKIVLEELSKLIAPFTPFLAENIWQELGRENSVHLADYPEPVIKFIDEKLEEQMTVARDIAAKGLALRAGAGIKVRQPLSSLKLSISNSQFLKSNKELVELIKDEVNVKEIVWGDKFELDTRITAELKEEGIVRELARQIQEMRRDCGLTPKNLIVAYFHIVDENLKGIVRKRQKDFISGINAKKIEFVGAVKNGLLIDRYLKNDNKDIWIGISEIK